MAIKKISNWQCKSKPGGYECVVQRRFTHLWKYDNPICWTTLCLWRVLPQGLQCTLIWENHLIFWAQCVTNHEWQLAYSLVNWPVMYCSTKVWLEAESDGSLALRTEISSPQHSSASCCIGIPPAPDCENCGNAWRSIWPWRSGQIKYCINRSQLLALYVNYLPKYERREPFCCASQLFI